MRHAVRTFWDQMPKLIVEDAFAITGTQLDQFDVVIDAFANHTEPEQNLDVLTHLIHQTRHHDVRMFFILGLVHFCKKMAVMSMTS